MDKNDLLHSTLHFIEKLKDENNKAQSEAIQVALECLSEALDFPLQEISSAPKYKIDDVCLQKTAKTKIAKISDSENLTEKAENLKNGGKFRQAIPVTVEALKRDPFDLKVILPINAEKARTLLADTLLELNRLEEAKSDYEMALEIASKQKKSHQKSDEALKDLTSKLENVVAMINYRKRRQRVDEENSRFRSAVDKKDLPPKDIEKNIGKFLSDKKSLDKIFENEKFQNLAQNMMQNPFMQNIMKDIFPSQQPPNFGGNDNDLNNSFNENKTNIVTGQNGQNIEKENGSDLNEIDKSDVKNDYKK
ncbi:hypothetical protein MHBO_002459 [Bonamia ostreae]|uniref:Uncharacterized protein n=1 Tax=Bonamia ostreae TaxID=126728 RepID=A0ABV2AMT7_9EUKA